MPKAQALPIEDDQARRRIVGILRERCPTGFQPRSEREANAKLTPRRRSEVCKLAKLFPGSLNIPDIDGRTALAWLSRYDEPNLLKLFLELGANPRGFGPDKLHPLAQACELRSGESLSVLAWAVDLDESVIDGHGDAYRGARAVFVAAMNCNQEGITTLLGLGANALLSTDDGDSAMHALAYFHKKIDLAGPCALVLAQAAPELLTTKNKAGLSPKDLALSQGSEMAQFFQSMEEALTLRKNISTAKSGKRHPNL